MSRKSQYSQLLASMLQAQSKQQQASPFEQSLLDQFNRARGVLDSHDYRNLGSYLDLQPLANQQRLNSYGGYNQGTVASGAESSIAYGQQRDAASGNLTREYQNYLQKAHDALAAYSSGVGNAFQGIRDNRLQNGVLAPLNGMAALVGGQTYRTQPLTSYEITQLLNGNQTQYFQPVENGIHLQGRPHSPWYSFSTQLLGSAVNTGLTLAGNL